MRKFTRGDANQILSETFLYDSLNRLTGNTMNSGVAGLVIQTYGYDSIGNITSRSDMGTCTYGAVNVRPHAVDHIAMGDGSTRRYSYDAVGNVIQEVQRDGSNNMMLAKGRTETWTSFNMPLAGALDLNNILAGANTDRGYTNHEHLDGLDLIHMNGRVYDPAIGRFISADPKV